MKRPMAWAYGITTVPQRRKVFAETKIFLQNAGFDNPRLFIDGQTPEHGNYLDYVVNDRTFRYPKLGAYGNWLLALWELFIREPAADRYALFQDDISMCLGVRQYLERCPYPEQGYLNLCTYPVNAELVENSHGNSPGWYLSNQKGKGAQALVFSREAVRTLLGQPTVVSHPLGTPHRKDRNIDGVVIKSFRKVGWQEYIHYPGLVNHIGAGLLTTARSQPQPPTLCYAGNAFNAMDFLCKTVSQN